VSIDPSRIYATGYSSGGYMAYHLARDSSDVFTAIITLACSLADITGTPSNPVAIWHWHGDSDTVTPWEVGEVALSALEGLEKFAVWNGEAVPNFVDIGGGTMQAALSTGWPVRYNLVPGATHMNTGTGMNRPTVLNWLLQFSR
jgi:predicted peptidase